MRPDENNPKEMAEYWEARYREVMQELEPLMVGTESAVECIHRLKSRQYLADQYQQDALRTSTFTSVEAAVLQLCSEAGEVAALFSKAHYKKIPMITSELALELGDVQWCTAIISDMMGWKLSTIQRKNIEKLRQRYPPK